MSRRNRDRRPDTLSAGSTPFAAASPEDDAAEDVAETVGEVSAVDSPVNEVVVVEPAVLEVAEAAPAVDDPPATPPLAEIPELVIPAPPVERPAPPPPARPARSRYLVLERISARGHTLDDGRMREHWEPGERAEFNTLVVDSAPHAFRLL